MRESILQVLAGAPGGECPGILRAVSIDPTPVQTIQASAAEHEFVSLVSPGLDRVGGRGVWRHDGHQQKPFVAAALNDMTFPRCVRSDVVLQPLNRTHSA